MNWRCSACSERLAQEWAERAPELPIRTPTEALILASIIEKETGREDERAKVAAVFVNRLRLGMRLQSDPTVIYGWARRYDGNLRRRDLKTDGPYNTYTRAGLPPTPIALPGAASLQAALHPAAIDALYFVATGTGRRRPSVFGDLRRAQCRAAADSCERTGAKPDSAVTRRPRLMPAPIHHAWKASRVRARARSRARCRRSSRAARCRYC